jgi:hypothetical protein
MTIESTLAERGGRYGAFTHHAEIAQDLQDRMRQEAGWQALAADQKQALTVIADKIARMLNGDANYRDNWHDIVGYAKLVDDRMKADDLKVFRETEAQPIPCTSLAPPLGTEWKGKECPACGELLEFCQCPMPEA